MKREPEHVRRARKAAQKHKAESKRRVHHPTAEQEPPTDPFSGGIRDEQLDQAPPPEEGGPTPRPEDEAGEGNKLNMATKIVLLAQAAGVRVFRTPDYAPYARMTVKKHHETYALNSTIFRRWLSRLYFKIAHRAANANAIADAVSILSAVAVHEGDEFEVHTRVARHANNIYLDLADADWRAVEISRDGWRIVAEPPVMFRRPPGMYSLPEPQPDGSINLLRKFVNTKSESGFRLIVAYLVAALRPGRPFPVLSLRGEQGSAKSTLARLVRSLIDPNKAPLRRPPRDDRDLIIAATNGWMVTFDNLSHIPEWLSDALCCLATGAGFGTRTLFTDGEETLFQATRPVILTAIEDVVTRGDLLDRCLSVELEPIPDDERRTEADLDASFANVHGLILGALLDAAAAALRNLPTVRLPVLPRMADFAQWVVAAEPSLGWTSGAFIADYSDSREQSHEAVLADSPIYEPLTRLLDSNRGQWQGTPSELLNALTGLTGEQALKSRTWPSKPNSLTNRLKRLAPALRAVGITVKRDREAHTGRRLVRLERHANNRHPSSPSSPPQDFHGVEGDDLRDGDDPGDDLGGQGDGREPVKNRRFSQAVTTGDGGDDLSQPSHGSDCGPYGQRF